MPNHCINTLYLSGDEEQIKSFFEGFDMEKGFIHTYYPIPEELANTIARNPLGSKQVTIKSGELDEWGHDKGIDLNEEDSLAFRKRNGGYSDWYSWCCDKWGTKWGDYDLEIVGLNALRFDSAWSPPIPALDVISRLFPDVEFELSYFESGIGFEGDAYFMDGFVSDDCRDIPEEWYDQFKEEEDY